MKIVSTLYKRYGTSHHSENIYYHFRVKLVAFQNQIESNCVLTTRVIYLVTLCNARSSNQAGLREVSLECGEILILNF